MRCLSLGPFNKIEGKVRIPGRTVTGAVSPVGLSGPPSPRVVPLAFREKFL
jgi:hypothetical protein